MEVSKFSEVSAALLFIASATSAVAEDGIDAASIVFGQTAVLEGAARNFVYAVFEKGTFDIGGVSLSFGPGDNQGASTIR